MTAKHISQFETPNEPLLPRQPNSRQRILVVEDDPMIRRLNIEVLMYSGYQVDAAEDGAAAWVALQQEHYDLIVTDNDMPNMTGVELLLSLHEAHLALPVVMATSTVPQEELDRRPWLQVDATLLKPDNCDELLATVKNVLSASTGDLGIMAPLPNWRSRPLPNCLSI